MSERPGDRGERERERDRERERERWGQVTFALILKEF